MNFFIIIEIERSFIGMDYLLQKDFDHRTGLLQGEASVQCETIQIDHDENIFILDRRNFMKYIGHIPMTSLNC